MNKSTKNNQTASDKVSKKEKLTLLQGSLATELIPEESESANPLPDLIKSYPKERSALFDEIDYIESNLLPKLKYLLDAQKSMVADLAGDNLEELVKIGMDLLVDDLIEGLESQINKIRVRVL